MFVGHFSDSGLKESSDRCLFVTQGIWKKQTHSAETRSPDAPALEPFLDTYLQCRSKLAGRHGRATCRVTVGPVFGHAQEAHPQKGASLSQTRPLFTGKSAVAHVGILACRARTEPHSPGQLSFTGSAAATGDPGPGH